MAEIKLLWQKRNVWLRFVSSFKSELVEESLMILSTLSLQHRSTDWSSFWWFALLKSPPTSYPYVCGTFPNQAMRTCGGHLYISLLLGWVGGQQLWWSNTISAASISLSSALSPVWVWCNLRGCRAAAFLLNAVTIFFGLQATTHSFTSLLTVFLIEICLIST